MQLKIKVPTDVHKAAHLIFIDEIGYSLIKRIINPPNNGKKIITDNKGQLVI